MAVRLRVENVSVRYLTGDIKNMGMKDYFIKKLKGQYLVHEFWADKHITFNLEDGDMLGIIGTNGAGKSTLLKAISGILSPSEGTIKLRGKIAALLELSSGFDPDLTVKENTYLRGAMLGYSRQFMNEKYDEIIGFAELQGFEDTPFRQLSSGMKSRLAFSIACLIQPDILILDEVLSVGDGAFRKKSEEKMRSIIANGATTILVSHSIAQIRRMSNKVLWLNKGEQIAFSDDVETVCLAYNWFLDHKKLPESEAEMAEMAQQQRKVEKEELRQRQNEMLQKAKEIKARRKAKAEKRKAKAEQAAQEAMAKEESE
jgi:ABC-2 type transport system ATP-binding protein